MKLLTTSFRVLANNGWVIVGKLQLGKKDIPTSPIQPSGLKGLNRKSPSIEGRFFVNRLAYLLKPATAWLRAVQEVERLKEHRSGPLQLVVAFALVRVVEFAALDQAAKLF